MAPLSQTSASAAARSPRPVLWIVGALAACFAVHTDAVRLDSLALTAVSSGEAMGVDSSSMVQTHDRDAPAVADRGRDLDVAAQLLGTVNLKYGMNLSNVRDLQGHLERLRTKVLDIGTFRDARLRDKVRSVLRDIRTKSEELQQMAYAKESAGEVDDGGDTFPSQRDNICNDVQNYYKVSPSFVDDLKELCSALDTVRSVVLAGADEGAAVFEVSGRINSIRSAKDYANPHISSRVASLLSEEWRWVTKHLALRPAVQGAAGENASSPVLESHSGARGLDTWLTDVEASSPYDPKVWEQRMATLREVMDSVVIDPGLSLSAVRTQIQRIALCKDMIAEYITTSEPEFRERIREVLREMKEKSDALVAMRVQREAAGEVDEVDELMPSQRNNICKNLDTYNLEDEWRLPLKHICDSLDRMRKAALAGEGIDAALMEVVGRMNVLKANPDYRHMPFAGKIELVFSEELRWANQDASDEE